MGVGLEAARVFGRHSTLGPCDGRRYSAAARWGSSCFEWRPAAHCGRTEALAAEMEGGRASLRDAGRVTRTGLAYPYGRKTILRREGRNQADADGVPALPPGGCVSGAMDRPHEKESASGRRERSGSREFQEGAVVHGARGQFAGLPEYQVQEAVRVDGTIGVSDLGVEEPPARRSRRIGFYSAWTAAGWPSRTSRIF